MPPTWPVTFADGSTIDVGLLKERGTEDFDGVELPDPLEPDYDNGRLVAKVFLDRNPLIYSFARGGRVFHLGDKLGQVYAEESDKPKAVDDALELMREHGHTFQSPDGRRLLYVSKDGEAEIADKYWLADYLDTIADWTYRYYDKAAQTHFTVKRGVESWLPVRLLSRFGNWKLPVLQGVLTAPTMALDGTILSKPGYDRESGLFLHGMRFPPLRKDKREALAIIMEPAKLFPFASEADKAVYVTAVLAGVIRKSLPTCPAFILDAPSAGTGKTYLGYVIQEIACGYQRALIVKEHDKAEFAKQLDSELLAGSPSLFFDNVGSGSKLGGQLDALLTSKVYQFRAMGGNKTARVSTQTLILISSNNFTPPKDLWRRILRCRLDAKTDAPERRRFPFDPRALAKEKRQEIVAAALGVLSAFIEAGKPRSTEDSMASYEDFDSLVRQCVLWLGLEDPLTRQAEDKESDPEAERLGRVFVALREAYGEELFVSADVIEKLAEMIYKEDLPCDVRNLGKWLMNNRDKRAAGLVLRMSDNKAQNLTHWFIQLTN